jgi:hypothetical protein
VTPVVPVADGPADTGPLVTEERDLTGERLEQLAGYEQDITAAQAAGMGAENDRRTGYMSQIEPPGSAYGAAMTLPPVPVNVPPPPPVGGYPFAGDEPVTA